MVVKRRGRCCGVEGSVKVVCGTHANFYCILHGALAGRDSHTYTNTRTVGPYITKGAHSFGLGFVFLFFVNVFVYDSRR